MSMFTFGRVEIPPLETQSDFSTKLNGEILYYYQNINEFKDFNTTIKKYKFLSEEKKKKLEEEASTLNEENLQFKIPNFIKTFNCKCYEDWSTLTKPCSICGKSDWDLTTINKCTKWFWDNERPTFNHVASPAWERELQYQKKLQFYSHFFSKYSNTIQDELTEKILSAVNYDTIDRIDQFIGLHSNSGQTQNDSHGEPMTLDKSHFYSSPFDSPGFQTKIQINEIKESENQRNESIGLESSSQIHSGHSSMQTSPIKETETGFQGFESSFQNDFEFGSSSGMSLIDTNDPESYNQTGLSFGAPTGSKFNTLFAGTTGSKMNLKYDYYVGKTIKLPQISIDNVRLSYPLQDFNFKNLSKSFYSSKEVKFISKIDFGDLHMDLHLSFEYYQIEFSHAEIHGKESTFSTPNVPKIHAGYLHIYLPSVDSSIELDLECNGDQSSFNFSLQDHEFIHANWIAFHDHCVLKNKPITPDKKYIVLVFDIFVLTQYEFILFSQLKKKDLVPHVLTFMEFNDGQDFCFKIDHHNLTQLNHRIYSQLLKYDGWKVSIDRFTQNINHFAPQPKIMNLYSTNRELLYEMTIKMKKKLTIQHFVDLNFKFK
jgi:hypothetical protein